MEWATMPLRRYAEFRGRSRRKELWMYFLLTVVATVIARVLDGVLGVMSAAPGVGIFTILTSLALIVPSTAVIVRRLHDTERSGWWYLIGLVPLVGGIVLLIFFLNDGTPCENRFGSDPKAGERRIATA